jgi:mannose-6-phosphate isomerase
MDQFPEYFHEDRPWGSYDRFTVPGAGIFKTLTVHPNMRWSLQRHAKRGEIWKVIRGSGVASIDGTDHPISVGDAVEAPLGALHRLTGGPDGITIMEIYTGEYDENDIERVEDDFGRAPAS